MTMNDIEAKERIARIIAPDAWKWHDRGMYQEKYEPDRLDSLAKADAILDYKDPNADEEQEKYKAALKEINELCEIFYSPILVRRIKKITSKALSLKETDNSGKYTPRTANKEEWLRIARDLYKEVYHATFGGHPIDFPDETLMDSMQRGLSPVEAINEMEKDGAFELVIE